MNDNRKWCRRWLKMNDQPIVILDINGSALGVVTVKDNKLMLCDKLGKPIREISEKMTIKAVKDVLVNLKLNQVIV